MPRLQAPVALMQSILCPASSDFFNWWSNPPGSFRWANLQIHQLQEGKHMHQVTEPPHHTTWCIGQTATTQLNDISKCTMNWFMETLLHKYHSGPALRCFMKRTNTAQGSGTFFLQHTSTKCLSVVITETQREANTLVAVCKEAACNLM